jgi:alpha-amylase
LTTLCLCFEVHQSRILKPYRHQDIGLEDSYEDESASAAAISRMAAVSYLPANRLLLNLIRHFQGAFKVGFSISGTSLELMKAYRPELLTSFRALVETGCAEMLGETYYHSLSGLYSKREFIRQAAKHADAVYRLFGVRPAVFRNTDLIHSNELAELIADMGFSGILCEGVGALLSGRSCNQLYRPPSRPGLGLLLRHQALSDDIAFHLGDPKWAEFPLSPEKYAGWIRDHGEQEAAITLSFDYATLGYWKKKRSGIMGFLQRLPSVLLSDPEFCFETPSGLLARGPYAGNYDVTHPVSWNDKNGRPYTWEQNMRQNNSLKKLYSLETMALASGSLAIRDNWAMLQAADYFRAMGQEDGGEQVFLSFMSILADLEIRLIQRMMGLNRQ